MELKVWVEGIQRIVCGVTETTTCQVRFSFFFCLAFGFFLWRINFILFILSTKIFCLLIVEKNTCVIRVFVIEKIVQLKMKFHSLNVWQQLGKNESKIFRVAFGDYYSWNMTKCMLKYLKKILLQITFFMLIIVSR